MPKSHDYENDSPGGSAEISTNPPKLPPKTHFKTSNQGLEVFKRQCSGGASHSNDSDTVYASSSCGGSSNITPILIQKENSNSSVCSDRLSLNHPDFRANPELIRINQSDRRANKPLVSPTARHLQLKLRRCESAEDDILSEKEFHGRHFLETLTLDKNDTSQSPSSIINQLSSQNSNQNSNQNSHQNTNQNPNQNPNQTPNQTSNQHSVPNLTSYQNPISNLGFISNQNSNSSQNSYQTPLTHSTNSQPPPQNTSTCPATSNNDTTQPLFLNIPRPPSRALSEIGTQATSMGTSTGYQSPSRPGSVYSYSGGTTCPNSGGSRCASPNLGSMPPSPLATGRASNTFVHRPVPLLPNPLLQTNPNNPLISQSPVCSDSEHMPSPSLNPAIINFAENHRRNLSTSSSLDCEQIENRISENKSSESRGPQNTENNEENCQQKSILNIQNSQIQNMFHSSHPTSHPTSHNQHNYLNNQYNLPNPLLSESDETAHVTILTAPVQTRRDSSSECLGAAATPQKKYITKRESFPRERKTPSPCLKPPSLLLTSSSLSVLQNNNLLNNPFAIGQKRPRPCSESSNFESGSFNKKLKDDKDDKNLDSCSFTSPGCGSLASCTDRMDTKMETIKFLSNSAGNSADKPINNFDKTPAAKKINLHTPQFQQTQNREQRLSAWVDSSRQFEGTPPSVPHPLPSPNSISSSSPVNLQRFAISTNSRDSHVASTTPVNVFPSPSSPFSLRSKSPTPSECSIGSSDLEVQRYTYKNANLPEPNKQLFRGYKQVKKLNEECSPLCSNNSFKQVGSISSSPLSKKTTQQINPTTNFKPISTTAAQSASISQSATTFNSASQAASAAAASSQQASAFSSPSVIHAVPAVPIEKKELPLDTSKSKQLHSQQPTESLHKTCSTENNDESQVSNQESETGSKNNSRIDNKNTNAQNLDNSDSSDQNMETSDPN